MATYTVTAAGGLWSIPLTCFGNAVAPTAADDVVLDGASGSNTIDLASYCRSFVCTGFTNELIGTSNPLTVGDGTTGHITLASGMTATDLSFVCISTATGNQVTSNGKTFASLTIASSGSWTTLDALSLDAATTSLHINGSGCTFTIGAGVTCSGKINLQIGTLNTAGFAVSSDKGTFGNGTSTRVLTLGATTWTVFGSGIDTFSCKQARSDPSSGLTVNAGTSVILFTYTSTAVVQFDGGGNTWNIIRVTMGGTGTFDITGNNTFNSIETTGTPTAKTIRFRAASTQTFTGATPIPSGTSGNLVTIASMTAATHTLSKASGTVSCDYLHLTNSIATGGATWYAGANSVDNGGNTGWIFTAPPAGGVSHNLLLLGVGT